MLNNKKSFVAILSLALLLAMACGAWAATGQVKADGTVAGSSPKTVSDDIETTANDNNGHGIYALSGGVVTNPGYDIETSGDNAYGAYASVASSIDMKGDILTKGHSGRGVQAYRGSYIKLEGDVTTHGAYALGIVAYNRDFDMASDDVSTVVFTGNIVTHGRGANGAVAHNNGSLFITNSTITTHEENATGLNVVSSSDATLEKVTITINYETAWAIGQSHRDTVINLVEVETEGRNALKAASGGVVNATDSTLAGDVFYDDVLGMTEDPLDITLKNSVLAGAVTSAGDIGVINITLEDSAWNVTGDSNTNGNVIADSSSKIDYNGAPENTTVIVDTLMGTPALLMKPGDELIIKSGDSVLSLESSDPDVVEIVENGDGSISIISRGEGEAELDYTYIDENGDTQSVTVGFTGGDGISSSVEGTPDPDKIQKGDEVDLSYSYGSAARDIDVVDVDGSGLIGSGLTAVKDAEGNILLSGTANEPGNYFFEVDMIVDGESVTKTETVNIAAPHTASGTQEDGKIESGMEVEQTHDFGDDYKAVDVDGSGLNGSGLTVSIDADGNVVLEGTATNPGEYFYEVTLERPDGSTFTQKVPVIVEAESTQQAYGGGGSSNCNAGLGFGALLSLLGMAVVQKRK